MKEAFGGISLFQIVIVFLVLFTGIMCLTINHSKAYAVKDEVINIIESSELNTVISDNNGDLSGEIIEKITNRMKEAGYRITGSCPAEEETRNEHWVGYDRNGSVNNSAPIFCVRSNNLSEDYQQALSGLCIGGNCTVSPQGATRMYYYDIVLFYQLDIPGLNQVMNFKLYGSTKVLFG